MLRDRQRQFAAAVLHGQPGVEPHIRPGRFAPAQLLQVYRNNLVENLTGALRAIYPVIEKLVGAGFFRYAAHEYLRQHPPRAGNLHVFGDRFADFLATFPPAATLPYLPDVARLEWAWHEAFHAADAAPLDTSRLASVPPDRQPQLRFILHPSARVVTSRYPIVRIFEANQDGYAGDPAVDLDAGGETTLVIRRGLDVGVEPLAAGEAEFLAALAAGQSLIQAVDAALAANERFDLDAVLGRHVRRGTLVDYFIDKTT
jgi:hypothetical protein